MEITIPKGTHFQRLPFDVLAHIFSFLTQSACLECSLVCRWLHEILPSCTRSVWKQLYREKPIPIGVTRFLGCHVKSFQYDDPGDRSRPEDIKALYKSFSRVDLSGLEALACHDRGNEQLPERDYFIQELGTNKLKTLSLKGEFSGGSVALLLERNAEHLRSVKFSSRARWSFWPVKVMEMPHLVKLELNMLLAHDKLKHILTFCPNLRFLDIPQSKEEITARRKELDMVLTKCPRLLYLGYRYQWPRRYMPIDLDRAQVDKPRRSQDAGGDTPRIAHLNIEGAVTHMEETFLPLIRSCSPYLESIVIDGCGWEDSSYDYFDWSWLITGGVHMPRLRYLYFRTVRFEADAFVQFIRRHAATLQAVGIHSVSFGRVNTDIIADAIRDIHRLEQLYHDSITFTNEKKEEIIRSHCMSLRTLHLCHSIAYINALVFLQLPHLEVLEIDFHRVKPADSQEYLRLLGDLPDTSPNLRSLAISNLESMLSDIILETIAQFRILRSLTLSQCSGWSETGMARFTKLVENRLESFRIANYPFTISKQTQQLMISLMGSHRIKFTDIL
ncbi:hypothetical protein BX666DRAFT_2026844 [Dichotomocladium elegans]|nr:hypothetical protein BX666DRAFT_2026844 [Dichotomocladium elegans]